LACLAWDHPLAGADADKSAAQERSKASPEPEVHLALVGSCRETPHPGQQADQDAGSAKQSVRRQSWARGDVSGVIGAVEAQA